MAYLPYGYSDGSRKSLIGFKGEWNEPAAAAYSLGNGHRFYLSGLSRFIVPDCASPFGIGGINAYCYCLGDPINRSDPTGEASVLWARAMAAYRRSKSGRLPTGIEQLPNEVLQRIASQLPGREMVMLSRTSKRMQSVVSGISKESDERFQTLLSNEPDTQSKMVLALKVSYGLERGILPNAAKAVKHRRAQMDAMILEANRQYYKPQVTQIVNARAIREDLLNLPFVHAQLMQGIG